FHDRVLRVDGFGASLGVRIGNAGGGDVFFRTGGRFRLCCGHIHSGRRGDILADACNQSVCPASSKWSPAMARLKIDQVSKTFNEFQALSQVSLDVKDGEFVAILGPSGCGKTTLLRMIAGFEDVDGGEIHIGETRVSHVDGSVPPEKRQVGIVFQNYALWPHMTVAENVGYSLRVAKVAKAERERRVNEALALVDLAGFGDRRPANLSGGQRQRVALARCLVAAPSLVLFDEPLA